MFQTPSKVCFPKNLHFPTTENLENEVTPLRTTKDLNLECFLISADNFWSIFKCKAKHYNKQLLQPHVRQSYFISRRSSADRHHMQLTTSSSTYALLSSFTNMRGWMMICTLKPTNRSIGAS